MQVKDLMTREVFTVRPEHKLNLVDDIMNWQRIRHIPVVDKKNHLVGLLTHRDLLKASLSTVANFPKEHQQELLRSVSVRHIMQKNVITTTPEADLRDVAAIMIDEKVGCLPVLDGKKLIGIITEADFLTLAWEAMGKKSEQKDFTSVRKYTKHADA